MRHACRPIIQPTTAPCPWLSRLRNTSDGVMDSIHASRNTTRADVAVLVINNASSCGLASGIGSTAASASSRGRFSSPVRPVSSLRG